MNRSSHEHPPPHGYFVHRRGSSYNSNNNNNHHPHHPHHPPRPRFNQQHHPHHRHHSHPPHLSYSTTGELPTASRLHAAAAPAPHYHRHSHHNSHAPPPPHSSQYHHLPHPPQQHGQSSSMNLPQPQPHAMPQYRPTAHYNNNNSNNNHHRHHHHHQHDVVSKQSRRQHPIHELTKQPEQEEEEESAFVVDHSNNSNNHGSPHAASPNNHNPEINPTTNQGHPLPLQPVPHNPNLPSSHDPAVDEAEGQRQSDTLLKPTTTAASPNHHNPHETTATRIIPVASQENSMVEMVAPRSAQKAQPSSTTMADPGQFMKSPVTLCFERMLGAAEYLAHNPTPEMVKKNLKRKEQAHPSAIAAATAMVAHAQPEYPPPNYHEPNGTYPNYEQQSESVPAPVQQVEAAAPTSKRTKTSRTTTTQSKAAPQIRLEQGNPFLELEQDDDLLQKVILQMALISESKETKRNANSNTVNAEPVPTTIAEGFYWRDYPVLEELLFDNMKSYYNMSSQNRQSRHQQDFNNRLVASIRQAAADHGLQFDPAFNDKRLRDRVRCFYKTHLQNAKKRLATLQKHPNSPIHQSHLRIYIRCVRSGLSLEESEAREAAEERSTTTNPAVVVTRRTKTTEPSTATVAEMV